MLLNEDMNIRSISWRKYISISLVSMSSMEVEKGVRPAAGELWLVRLPISSSYFISPISSVAKDGALFRNFL